MKNISMLDAIRELGSKLNTYTNDCTTEDRTKVFNKNTNEEGIVIGNNGDKVSVKWLKTGSIKDYSKKELENVNSDVFYGERVMTLPSISSIVNPVFNTSPQVSSVSVVLKNEGTKTTK